MLRDAEYDDQIEADDEESDEGATVGGPMDTDDMIEDLYGDDEEDDEDETDEAVRQAWGGI
jgi:hypothetical protein